ncbi:DapH/DapD/GlmU-related protein [Alkalicoccus chagannorensis]|uniref:DapH/DapD/GlmU-related protein n=1 Tax=Alkalicoccus chagannorensis TaxID=427072 RepID=UPI00040384CE|nr:DapH/DapD/GlmU-related protein [Alkalicoccus chagannorensis]
MTEKENMLQGRPYQPADEALEADRYAMVRMLGQLHDYHEEHTVDRLLLLKEILGSCPDQITVGDGFRALYGYNIHIEGAFAAAADCYIQDAAPVTFGSRCTLGPGVHLYTSLPLAQAGEKNTGIESASPVSIGDDVRIGGRALLYPGIHIGSRSIVDPGVVLTSDVPADTHVSIGSRS